MNLSYCLIGQQLCLARPEWITLIGSFGGVFFAFLLGILFERVTQRSKRRAARRAVRAALTDMMNALAPYRIVDDEERAKAKPESSARACAAIVRGRAMLDWSLQHAEHFEHEQFAQFHETAKVITNWLDDNSRMGGFIASLYNGQASYRVIRSLALSLQQRTTLESLFVLSKD